MLNNLRRPHITLALSGDLDFNDLNRIFRSGYIRDQTGFVSGSIRMAGTVPDSISIASALPYLKPEVSLLFREFGATVADRGLSFSGVNGALGINNDLVADNLTLTFRDQRFTLNTVMKNFIPWLAGSSVHPVITGEIHADRLVTASFAGEKDKNAGNDTLSSDRKPADLFPSDITANVRLRADSLIVNKFRASGFTTRLVYKPYVITFEEARAEGLEGVLTGDFMLGRQKEGGYISRVRLDVSEIDINKAFTAFNNFGQDFIISDNLQGRLTGNVTVLSPHDGNYRIMRKAIAAEAHLEISEGKLISFAPAESLSSYLDLSELKNISFSRMENDLYINNGTVSIPKMLINSTAVNFTVYGTHGFDGDYSYHMRLLLSEVMSRKARERNRDVSSFGQVKVDGSGKATVPLKIECINGKTSVSYDFGQAQENIKNDIAVEKQTLKGILNEEYGWYETDTARIRPAENKPRFSVTWEEGKEQPATTESHQEEVKESPIKILLKKKK
jgi:hypothetical protein